MQTNEAEKFKSMVTVLHQAFQRREPDRELLRLWWVKLAKFDINDIAMAMDSWIDSQDKMVTIHELMELCKPKVTIHARIASPLNIEANKRHADKLMATVNKLISPQRDHKAWARKILANPHGRPEIAIRFAKEAINAAE